MRTLERVAEARRVLQQVPLRDAEPSGEGLRWRRTDIALQGLQVPRTVDTKRPLLPLLLHLRTKFTNILSLSIFHVTNILKRVKSSAYCILYVIFPEYSLKVWLFISVG